MQLTEFTDKSKEYYERGNFPSRKPTKIHQSFNSFRSLSHDRSIASSLSSSPHSAI